MAALPHLPGAMLLLLDIGNTHTHFAAWDGRKLRGGGNISTAGWAGKGMPPRIRRLVRFPSAVALCSVVPAATLTAKAAILHHWRLTPFELSAATSKPLKISYPAPSSIGADRLANAIAARELLGAPAVVVDFGTAVTFDVLDAKGRYAGGIIAPGLAVMTTYLHEKTALLPRIRIRDTAAVVGKSTREAMLIGAVHGYRGLIRGLLHELKAELRSEHLPVVATGGYAALLARRLPEITRVEPMLTLTGLRMAWMANRGESWSPSGIRPHLKRI